jgi:hypothetical protein
LSGAQLEQPPYSMKSSGDGDDGGGDVCGIGLLVL